MSDQSGYVRLDLVGDFDSLANTGTDYMAAVIDGWEANPGNPDTVMIEASAQMGAEVIDQAAEVPPEAMAYIGTSIYNIPIEQGTPSVCQATLTFAADTPAVTIVAESAVAVPHPSGESFIFLTDRDLIAPMGGGVLPLQLVCIDAGADSNGAFGVCELVETVDGVEQIVAETAVEGTDVETPQEYLNRLSDLLGLLNTHPILPQDHAKRARRTPGVSRATAIDLYMPAAAENPVGDITAPEYLPAGAANKARCTTVAILGPNFAAPSAQLKTNVYNDLNANREVNFLNYVIGPTFTIIDLQAVVVPYPGFSQQDAIDSATAMVETWLSAENWGAPPGGDQPVEWSNDNTVWLYEAVDWLNRGGGVYRVKSVQMKKRTDSVYAAADIVLTGTAALPQIDASSINITAAAS